MTVLLIIAAGGQLGWQAHRACYVLPADPRNPYVYVHTLPDIKRLAADVEQLAAASPEGDGMQINVIWTDDYYWPLPWYLRRCEAVGWWMRLPEDPSAPVVIAAASYDAELTPRLDATHLMTGYYALRPGVLAAGLGADGRLGGALEEVGEVVSGG